MIDLVGQLTGRGWDRQEASVAPRGEELRSGLDGLAASYTVIGEDRGNGLLLAVELVGDKATGGRFDDQDRVGRFTIAEGLRQGLLMIVNSTTINIMPALTITSEEIVELVDRLGRVIGAVQDEFGWAA